jgi:TPR repeat protein
MLGTTKKKPTPKGRPQSHSDGTYTSEQQKADFNCATGYKNGKVLVRSPAIRVQLLHRVAQGPSAKWRGHANYKLGALHEEGIKGLVKRDPYLARGFYEKAAADGDHPASIRMLRMEHFPEVYIKLRQSEFAPPRRDERSPGSLQRATELYSQEKYTEALPIFIYHARRRSSDAQYTLAIMYGLGDGVEADELRARAWCYLAAKSGLKVAQSALGCDLLFDRTVPNDEAELWLKRAARRNDPEAIGHLGIMNMSSLDWRRKPNVKLGLSYLEKAASMGSPFAMLRLGEIYLGKVFTGSVTVDHERAKAWYMAAADTGDQEARKLLRKDFKMKYDGRAVAVGKTAPPKSRSGPQKSATRRSSKKK